MMTLEEEKMRDVERCLQIAESTISSGNFDKAERLLLKAERLYPTKLAKAMLSDIEAARGNVSFQSNSEPQSESSNASGSENSYQRSEEDECEAEKCIEIAQRAMSEGKFDRAKRFLVKSMRIYPFEIAQELLDNLDDMESNFSFSSYCANRTSTLGNRLDAEKCVERAEAEFAKGSLGRAERLLLKAERLCPTIRAKDLLRQVREAKGPEWSEPEAPRSEARQPTAPPRQERERRRAEPTPEQVEAINRVKNGKDDYDVLGIEKKGCTISAVRKAYRRLTLLLHPDKNKAAGAKEAFMIVLEAMGRIESQQKALRK